MSNIKKVYKYSDYVPENERPVLTMLLKEALKGGNSISVSDGEDTVLSRSLSLNECRASLGGTGEDFINIFSTNEDGSEGEFLGYFYCIYNNGSEDDPMTVICDYACTDLCDAIYLKLMDCYGE